MGDLKLNHLQSLSTILEANGFHKLQAGLMLDDVALDQIVAFLQCSKFHFIWIINNVRDDFVDYLNYRLYLWYISFQFLVKLSS